MLKKTFLLLLFICFGARAFSAVFVVTSNADSGPGTLRDALTQAAANGSAEKDYINFNLPDLSEAGRTITISSELPYLSSNLVIDGTTQPGTAFGVSNAKVILQPIDPSNAPNALLAVNVNGFEIYGMYIRDFRGQYAHGGQGVDLGTAVIYVETSDNLQIGAPGKGNVFANNSYILSPDYVGVNGGSNPPAYSVNNLQVYSNFFGTEPDGVTLRGGYSSGIDVSYCKGNIFIGGPDISQRNIFDNCSMAISGFFTGQDRLFASKFIVENNYIGYDINGNPVKFPNLNADGIYAFFFDISRWEYPYDFGVINYPYSFSVLNNKIQYPYETQISYLTGPIIFQGNKILYEPSTFFTTFGYDTGIGLASVDSVKIGGINPGEPNIIYGESLRLNSQKSILLHQNSIYCVNLYGTSSVWGPNATPDARLPIINIDSVSTNYIKGTATPLSSVELFQDDSCVRCEPMTYFATVNTDASGKWSYLGPITKGIIASATLNGFTSLFTATGVLNTYNIIQSACGNNGSITNINLANSGGYKITDQNNNLVSTNKDATNLAPGIYTITTGNSTCASKFTIQVFDASPQIDSHYVQIAQPSCGQSNGTIQNLFLSSDNNQVLQSDYSAYTYKWLDSGGKIVGTGMNAGNLAAGVYHLEVSYKGKCTATYGPVTLKNTTGPNIDQSQIKVQSTNCGQSTGSITSIPATGTGTLKYSWVNNSTQQTVSTDSILVNQPAGTYKLQVTDDTQCGPVYSSTINIPETNGIAIDTSKLLITPSSCGIANGSVTNLQATGATSYQWVNANGNVVNTSSNLTNAAAGKYTFTASNSFGCSKTLVYTIPQLATTKLPDYPAKITTACNTTNNGGIDVTTDGLVKLARWVDSTGTTIGTSATLSQVFAGTYQLYLTDQNGCESFYKSYIIPSYPEFTIANYGTTSADECNLNNGAVSATTMAGGVPPYIYKWTDLNGKQLSTNNAINNLGAGDYYLFINDTGGCGSVRITYTIPSSTESLPAPSVSDMQLCSSGSGLITVNNASANNNYRLYNSPTAAQPIDEQKGGRFTVNVTENSTYYVSEVNGSCESNRMQVNVTVGISVVNIANTITPNGDGINDYWQIAGIENYPDALVQIFNRYGQKLFESKGYSIPFDGTYKGQKLAAGVYYYIINLNTKCNLLSGSLTILR